MKLYLLTAETLGESETPVLIGTGLEAVKNAAVLTSPYPPDGFNLYESEDGTKPELLAYNVIRQTWDHVARTSSYALTGWTPA